MTAILINCQSQVLYNLCEINTTIIRNNKYLHMYLYYGTLRDREFEILQRKISQQNKTTTQLASALYTPVQL